MFGRTVGLGVAIGGLGGGGFRFDPGLRKGLGATDPPKKGTKQKSIHTTLINTWLR